MLNLFKWIYKLGYDKSRTEMLSTLERARDFHYTQEQIKLLTKNDDYKTSANEHATRRKEVNDLLNSLDPDKYLDMLL